MSGRGPQSRGPVLSASFDNRLAALAGHPGLLNGARRGIEKESLRVTRDGYISAQPHPPALGSALTNKHITTDFSEALLEFITPPLTDCWGAVQFLCDLHQFVGMNLDDEFSEEELMAYWDLWLKQAQASNDFDKHTYSHGVFKEEPY